MNARWIRGFAALGYVCLAACSTSVEPTESAEPVEASQAALSDVPTGFTDSTFVTGLDSPTAMQFAPDGRLFIAEQTGDLRVVKGGALLAAPFVSLPVTSAGERGLLGIAFDPSFANNHFVYLYYTATSPAAHNRVSRFVANGDVAAAGETVLLDLDNLSGATNHNGGAMNVGADGKLYIAVGENANGDNAQSFGNLLGKILRMNLDGSIPGDNPFFASAAGKNRLIWALGLRNPFTFAFKPGTSRMFINDVGQDNWEEIDDGIAGSNYGWPNTEGTTTNAAYRSPLFTYSHGEGCAITGGAFYTPSTAQFPASYSGKYFYADYCSGWIRAYDPVSDTSASFADSIAAPVDIKVGSDGSLYYLERGTGSVNRIRYTASTAPQIVQQPVSKSVAVGQTATFTCSASGTAPLTWRWQRNQADIAGATASSYTTPAATAVFNGTKYRCIATNAVGSATSSEATLTVVTSAPPTGVITSPAVGTTYRGGSVISFAGTATDPENGVLPASAFTWRIDFHHDAHTHPAMASTSGIKSGSFTVPTSGETSPNVWYRVHLTVTDSTGLTHDSYVDVLPKKVELTLTTTPAGIGLTLDGQPIATPAKVTSVVGIQRSIGAPPGRSGGLSYSFLQWSDDGAQTHMISTPTVATTYTATYGFEGGLRGEYFDNADLTASKLVRTDHTVNFDWGTGSPDPSLGADSFSVRWTGTVEPAYSQTYTFYTQANDGVRLWVNNKLLINDWNAHTLEEASGTIALTAGKRVDIKLEYFENTNLAAAKLLWSSPSQPKQVIPQNRLRQPGDAGCSAAGSRSLDPALLFVIASCAWLSSRRRRIRLCRPSS